MSEIKFKANTNMFGCMAYIKTDFSEAIHQYKVIGGICTNHYSDVPIKYDTEPYVHEELEDVLLVLHCGIAEDTARIHRVALKDCEKVTNPKMQEILERLEERIRILDNTSDINYPSVDVAIKETERIIQIIKEVGGMND